MSDEDIYNQVPTLFMNETPEEIDKVMKELNEREKAREEAIEDGDSEKKESPKRKSKKKPAKKKTARKKVSKKNTEPEPTEEESGLTNGPQDDGMEDTADAEPSGPIETASQEHDANEETRSSEGNLEDDPSEDHPTEDKENDEGKEYWDEANPFGKKMGSTDGTPVPAFVGVAEKPFDDDDDDSDIDDQPLSNDVQPTSNEDEDAGQDPVSKVVPTSSNEEEDEETDDEEIDTSKVQEYETEDGEVIRIRPAVTRVDDDDDEGVSLCPICGLPFDEDDAMEDEKGVLMCSTCLNAMRREAEGIDEEEESEEESEVPPDEDAENSEVPPDEDADSDAEEDDDDDEEKPESEPKGIFQKLKQRDEDIRKERKQKSKDKKKKKKHKKDDNYNPDSFRERMRRWYLWRFKGYVKLRTLSRMKNGEYKMETTLVKFKDLPRDAVACTGERGFYCHDTIVNSDWYLENHIKDRGLAEDQFTASDACLYMLSNKIDNALAVNWTEMNHVDFTKIVLIVGVVLVVALVVVTRM